jgi:tetratricopeptide (TPR) repeat protein
MKKVTDLSPQLGAAWSFLGLSEYELKNYSAAQTHLEKGIAVGNADDPEVDRVAQFHLALLLIRSRDFAQAQKLLVPQFVSPPVAEQVRTALGLLLLRVPLVGQEIDPSRDAIVSAAGDLQLQLLTGKKPDGLAAMQTIVAENRDKPVAHEILARCYDAMQNSAAAAKERAAAEALLPKPNAATERDAQLTAFLARGGGGIAVATNSGWTTGAMDSFEALVQQAASAQQSGNPSAATPLYEKLCKSVRTGMKGAGTWRCCITRRDNFRRPLAH